MSFPEREASILGLEMLLILLLIGLKGLILDLAPDPDTICEVLRPFNGCSTSSTDPGSPDLKVWTPTLAMESLSLNELKMLLRVDMNTGEADLVEGMPEDMGDLMVSDPFRGRTNGSPLLANLKPPVPENGTVVRDLGTDISDSTGCDDKEGRPLLGDLDNVTLELEALLTRGEET